MVLRLLPSANDMLAFPALGMSQEQTEQMRLILQNPSGLILVAGATGAGKTTTLYAMMLQLSRWRRRVVSIEDPVEMALPDCHQVQVRERIGVTFEAGLKALLRQDPDVIMVGEIRDDATARVALRAAMSGHLVLSTTHAQDLVGAVARLVEFGLSRALVCDLLRAVIVQELYPQPCQDCNGAGCRLCEGTGWDKERRARFDIHPMSISMTQLLASDRSWVDIRRELAGDRQRSR
jgi:type II secretory ATPase GspE/PulE/Tfp pilus assembly ATPase PilB-like protein